MTKAQGFPGDPDYVEGDNYEDADSLLGAPIPSASFPEIGTTVRGTILAVDTSEQRDPDGTARTFQNGQVRRQVILTLQTPDPDPEDDDDDGRRRLFVKGMMTKAFREAMKAAKVPGPRPGGHVTVTYDSDGEVATKGLNPPKLFTVAYEAPATK
jgi:hypothetical protein